MTPVAMRKVKASFVRQLREAMRAQKVTPSLLAQRLKVSRARITQALKPASNMTTLMMVRLADAVGMELHFSVTPKGTKDPRNEDGSLNDGPL